MIKGGNSPPKKLLPNSVAINWLFISFTSAQPMESAQLVSQMSTIKPLSEKVSSLLSPA